MFLRPPSPDTPTAIQGPIPLPAFRAQIRKQYFPALSDRRPLETPPWPPAIEVSRRATGVPTVDPALGPLHVTSEFNPPGSMEDMVVNVSHLGCDASRGRDAEGAEEEGAVSSSTASSECEAVDCSPRDLKRATYLQGQGRSMSTSLINK